jgi:hypothetical protein
VTWPCWHDDIGKSFGAVMEGVDAFLLGRRTCVTHAQAFEPMPARDPCVQPNSHLDVLPRLAPRSRRLVGHFEVVNASGIIRVVREPGKGSTFTCMFAVGPTGASKRA